MRYASFDIARIVAINCVIFIHTSQYYLILHPGGWKAALVSVIDSLSRFAVPFFFMSAGYFLGRKVRSGADLHRTAAGYIKRYAGVLLAWSVVYLIVPTSIKAIEENGLLGAAGETFRKQTEWITNNPLLFAQHSTSIHLWFLIALIVSYLFILASNKRTKAMLAVSVAAYILGLLGGAYSIFPAEWKHFFDTNTSFLAALLYVSSGYLLSGKEALPGKTSLLGLAVAGMLLHLGENYLVSTHLNARLMQPNVFSTPLFTMGIMLLALKYQGPSSPPLLSRISKLTLGVYLSHVLIILFLVDNTTFWKSDSLYVLAGFNLTVYFGSVVAALLFSRVPLLKKVF